MLIQNVGSTVQAPPPDRIVNSGFSSDGGSAVIVATPPLAATPPVISVDLPKADAKQVANQQPTAAQLQNVVDNINKVLKESNKNLEFSVDAETRKTLVKLIDTNTGEVIREFPSKEALAIAHSIDQFQQGLLLRQKA